MSALFMTLVGVVGTEPRKTLWNGNPVLSFRMVASERRYDNVTQNWVDVHSSWVSVSCFRRLARNVGESIQKGDRLVVHGKVRVKDWINDSGQQRTVVDIEAIAIGHDLTFGTTRLRPMTVPENTDDRLSEQADAFAREKADLPQESVRELLAQRAAAVDPDLDDELADDPDLADGLEDADALDDDEEADRRTPASTMAGVG